MSDAWWISVNGPYLAQGDLLPDCRMPVFDEELVPNEEGEPYEHELVQARLIVVTQSCDLENKKAEFVALCRVHTLPEFEEFNPEYDSKSQWENVRKRRKVGLYLLASPHSPGDNRAALVITFNQILSLPFVYVTRHASSLENRWRLQSPFLEHFSQAFARFFMRVGLPSSIPPFK